MIRVLQEVAVMDQGGVESLLMNLYRNIDRNKVQFDFMVHRKIEGCHHDEIRKLGGNIYYAKPFNPLRHSEYIRSMNDILKSGNWDIIHAHSDLNYWPLREAEKNRINTRIAHSHNAKTKKNLKYYFMKYQQKLIKNVATDLFMCSTPAGEWAYGKSSVQNGRCIFLKNGIEVEKFSFNKNIRNQMRESLGVTDKFVVCNVGKFMEQKNHTFMLDVFCQLLKTNEDAVLLLVGDGELKKRIHIKALQLGLGENVMFLGQRSDVNHILQAADVFFLPSLWEGLPLVLVEAQAAGLPCVISDVITNEVDITDCIIRKSFNDSIDEWVKEINASKHLERRDNSAIINDAGFNIKSTAKWLQDFYISAVAEKGKNKNED